MYDFQFMWLMEDWVKCMDKEGDYVEKNVA